MNLKSMILLPALGLLSNTAGAQAPSLPPGLGGDSQEPTVIFETKGSSQEKKENIRESYIDYMGFIDVRTGMRTGDDPNQKDLSLGEIRLHNEFNKDLTNLQMKLSADFLADAVEDNWDDTDLRYGTGIIDLREANFSTSPVGFMDLKMGRQILTWGTGDLIFINDLFPKDWKSFFSGRDLEYLKAPSDAIKVSFFTDLININLVYTPLFNPDRHINGSRFSYYSPLASTQVGRKSSYPLENRENYPEDGEYALRLYKNIGTVEVALYGHQGYWKSPMGVTSEGRFYFPELQVYGASLRGAFAGGISNLELGHYYSREDKRGDNLAVPNSETRYLLGHEREMAKNMTGSFQFYIEHMHDYDSYKASAPIHLKAKNRQMATLKIRQDLLRQTLAVTGMLFYSPTDKDGHLRLSGDYKWTDELLVGLGANIFQGKQNYTFWGQFEDNSNIYAFAKYSF